MLKLFIEPFMKDIPDRKEMNKKQKLISAFFSISSLVIMLFILSYFVWTVLVTYSGKINFYEFLSNLKWIFSIAVIDYLWLVLGKGFINSCDK